MLQVCLKLNHTFQNIKILCKSKKVIRIPKKFDIFFFKFLKLHLGEIFQMCINLK